ncbi:MAG: sulfotransferase [Anaerolineae bacterium]|nr:sulfotransferase [Anaerolineae bacterium]
MPVPNFLLIGAAKSGTTSIYKYLEQHPQIFLPPKPEQRFFLMEGKHGPFTRPGNINAGRQIVTNWQDYQAIFQDVTTETAIGEGSNDYLWGSGAACRIYHYLPTIKLIAILRHPVDRAYSEYWMRRRDRGFEPLSFSEAVQAEINELEQPWQLWSRYYLRGGFYYRHLTPFFNLFERGQLKIYLLDDLKQQPLLIIQDMYRFLGVEPDFQPNLAVWQNRGGQPKPERLYWLLSEWQRRMPTTGPLRHPFMLMERLKRYFLIKPPPISPTVRQMMLAHYRADTLNLQTVLQRDLSHWLV